MKAKSTANFHSHKLYEWNPLQWIAIIMVINFTTLSIKIVEVHQNAQPTREEVPKQADQRRSIVRHLHLMAINWNQWEIAA